MSRHNHLQHIADALVGSFNSRNNDVDGAWALGLLYAFSLAQQQEGIAVDLLRHQMEPSTSRFDVMIERYQSLLWALLDKQHIPTAWLRSVQISVVFNVVFDERYHKPYDKGQPCLSRCTIIDECSKTYTACAGSFCAPTTLNA